MEQFFNSHQHLVLFVIIIASTIALATITRRLMRRFIASSSKVMNLDLTRNRFFMHSIIALIYIVGLGIAIYTVPQLRTLASSLLAGAGILAVAVGFASQKALSNIIGGLFLIIFKPFRVGDRITIQNTLGTVEDITLRHTIIRDLQNQRYVIPNANINEEVIVNSDFGEEKICAFIEFSIAYDADVDLAKKIILEEVAEHPISHQLLPQGAKSASKDAFKIRVISLGESSVDIRCWVWTKDILSSMELQWDLNDTVKKRFDEVGIEIPFPHRTLVHKNLPQEK